MSDDDAYELTSIKYVSWSPEDAVKHYLTRISSRIPQFQTMEEKDLNYIKVRTLSNDRHRILILDPDDQCGRATHCEQPQLWLPLQPDCLLSVESAHQVETNLLRAGRQLSCQLPSTIHRTDQDSRLACRSSQTPTKPMLLYQSREKSMPRK